MEKLTRRQFIEGVAAFAGLTVLPPNSELEGPNEPTPVIKYNLKEFIENGRLSVGVVSLGEVGNIFVIFDKTSFQVKSISQLEVTSDKKRVLTGIEVEKNRIGVTFHTIGTKIDYATPLSWYINDGKQVLASGRLQRNRLQVIPDSE